MKPTDQIELGQGKMEDVTWNASEFPGYDIQVSAGDVKKTAGWCGDAISLNMLAARRNSDPKFSVNNIFGIILKCRSNPICRKLAL